MKFSALLPTRNGGDYLENCILSILEQEDDDFELVISDNANTDRTAGVIARYATDPRVVVVRQDEVVGVTENWNRAFAACRGDYILMMGDDDYLLPGYFARMRAVVARHDAPDCVIYNGYSYVAPDSIDGNRESLFSEAHFSFGPDFTGEGPIPAAQRRGIVRDMFRFHVRIPLNMQTTLLSRRATGLIRGGVFQPPFPDHYALNALMLLTDRWVYLPERLVVVGVSPKSFGHYVYSNQQAGGMAYLGIDADFPGRLPGNELLNGMHAWMDRLRREFPQELAGVAVDRAAYVRRQAYAWVMQRRFGTIGTRQLLSRCALLSTADWFGLASTLWDPASWRRARQLAGSDLADAAQAQWHGLRPLAGVADIRQFAAWVRLRGGARA